MSVTQRFRAALARDDAGAIAIVVALLSLVLFGIAALVVDIGSMYSRRRAAQTDADFAALAGVTALPGDQATARARAYDYLARNLPSGGALPALAEFGDGDLSDGEILFPTATSIRVVVPPRRVDFGFAGVFGYSEADVTAAATAAVRSPGKVLPFYLTVGGANGYSCLKDSSGGPNPSVMREALAAQQPNRPPAITATAPATVSTNGGETLTVTGDNFTNPAPDVTSVRVDGTEVSGWVVTSRTQLTVPTPAHAAGDATLTVTNAHGTASAVFTYATPPPAAAPTVTAVTPASGPTTGGTQVTITGTGFSTATGVTFGTVPAVNPTITNATTIAATAPPGTGAVHVRVTGPGGTSAETDADVFTYEVDACAGVSGSFGYLDIPRSKEPLPQGANAANDLVMINIASGIDHGWTVHPAFANANAGDDPVLDTKCQSGNTTIAGAVLDNGTGVDGANCIDVQSGNKIADIGRAFLDGFHKYGYDVGARLAAPDGHTAVTLHGYSGMDGDRMTKYLNVPLTTFTDALTNGTAPDPDWLDSEIAECPRFALVPVLNVSQNPQNGFYPIKEFAAVFLDGPAPNHGFEPNNNGTQVQSIRAYAFGGGWAEFVLPNGSTDSTTTYLGSGPKVPVLVHDAGDPSY